MVTTTRRYTAEDLRQMPGDEPWELWDGELRTVPGSGIQARHIALVIGSALLVFVRPRRLGVVTTTDGSYVFTRDPDTIVVPDVAFIRWDRLPGGQMTEKDSPVPPDLAVDVQSPSNEPGDMAEKRACYARAGVPLLWWVDSTARTVTVHRPTGRPSSSPRPTPSTEQTSSPALPSPSPTSSPNAVTESTPHPPAAGTSRAQP